MINAHALTRILRVFGPRGRGCPTHPWVSPWAGSFGLSGRHSRGWFEPSQGFTLGWIPSAFQADRPFASQYRRDKPCPTRLPHLGGRGACRASPFTLSSCRLGRSLALPKTMKQPWDHVFSGLTGFFVPCTIRPSSPWSLLPRASPSEEPTPWLEPDRPAVERMEKALIIQSLARRAERREASLKVKDATKTTRVHRAQHTMRISGRVQGGSLP